MKKLITLALSLALALSLLTACGSGDSGNSGSSSTPGTSQGANNNGGSTENADTLTASNWQKVIKEVYGFDLTVPAGWTFKEGGKQSAAPSYNVQFTTEAEDFKAEYETFVQFIFALTEKITPATGNHSGEYPDYTGDKMDEVPKIMGEILAPIWCFDTSKFIVQVDIMESEDNKTVQLYFVAAKYF